MCQNGLILLTLFLCTKMKKYPSVRLVHCREPFPSLYKKNAKLSLDGVNLPEICWVCLVVLARFTLYPNIFDFAHKDVMRDCQPLSVWPDREFIRPICTVVNQGYVMLWNSTYLQILTLGYRSVEMVKVAWNWENVPAEAHRIRHLAKICEST